MQIARLTSYGLVGTTGIVIDFTVTWLCKEKFHWNKYLSNSVGFGFAVINNYLLNRFFTFHNIDPAVLLQFFKFLLIAVAGLGLSNLFLFLFQKYSGLNFYICKLLVIALVFGWNYLANTIYTFKS